MSVSTCGVVVSSLIRGVPCALVAVFEHGLVERADGCHVPYPQHIRALCLLAMPFGRGKQGRRKAAALVAALAEAGVAATMEKLVKLWYTDAFVTLHPGVLAKRLHQIAGIDEAAFLETYRLYARIDIDREVGLIRVPTLIATGELANGCGADMAHALHAEIGGSRLTIFREMKNGILTEIPARVAETIATFFGDAVADIG